MRWHGHCSINLLQRVQSALFLTLESRQQIFAGRTIWPVVRYICLTCDGYINCLKARSWLKSTFLFATVPLNAWSLKKRTKCEPIWDCIHVISLSDSLEQNPLPADERLKPRRAQAQCTEAAPTLSALPARLVLVLQALRFALNPPPLWSGAGEFGAKGRVTGGDRWVSAPLRRGQRLDWSLLLCTLLHMQGEGSGLSQLGAVAALRASLVRQVKFYATTVWRNFDPVSFFWLITFILSP